MPDAASKELRARVAAMSPDERRAFWNRLLCAVNEDVLDDDYPIELVDEELRAHGVDPEAFARKAQAMANAALARAKGGDGG